MRLETNISKLTMTFVDSSVRNLFSRKRWRFVSVQLLNKIQILSFMHCVYLFWHFLIRTPYTTSSPFSCCATLFGFAEIFKFYVSLQWVENIVHILHHVFEVFFLMHKVIIWSHSVTSWIIQEPPSDSLWKPM